MYLIGCCCCCCCWGSFEKDDEADDGVDRSCASRLVAMLFVGGHSRLPASFEDFSSSFLILFATLNDADDDDVDEVDDDDECL